MLSKCFAIQSDFCSLDRFFSLSSVTGAQTVPRAELHTPTKALQQFSHAHNILIVTDAEDYFLTASTPERLEKALRSCNADMWVEWGSEH